MTNKTTDMRILEFLAQQEQCVTFREISQVVGIATSNVYKHMVRLRKDGLVTWQEGKQRTIRLARDA